MAPAHQVAELLGQFHALVVLACGAGRRAAAPAAAPPAARATRAAVLIASAPASRDTRSETAGCAVDPEEAAPGVLLRADGREVAEPEDPAAGAAHRQVGELLEASGWSRSTTVRPWRRAARRRAPATTRALLSASNRSAGAIRRAGAAASGRTSPPRRGRRRRRRLDAGDAGDGARAAARCPRGRCGCSVPAVYGPETV